MLFPHKRCDLEFLRWQFSAFDGPRARQFRQPDGKKAGGNAGNPTPAIFEAVAADENVDSPPQPGDVPEADKPEDPT